MQLFSALHFTENWKKKWFSWRDSTLLWEELKKFKILDLNFKKRTFFLSVLFEYFETCWSFLFSKWRNFQILSCVSTKKEKSVSKTIKNFFICMNLQNDVNMQKFVQTIFNIFSSVYFVFEIIKTRKKKRFFWIFLFLIFSFLFLKTKNFSKELLEHFSIIKILYATGFWF